MGRHLVALALIASSFGVACGAPPRPNVGASTLPASSPTSEARANALIVLMSRNTDTTMSLRILSTRGAVVANTQFAPPPRPAYGPCATLVQPPVRVANGAAYFADSTGIVRRLTPTGAITKVATFQLTNRQQALSYAVSPDGSRLIAIVISTPPLHDPPPQTLGDPLYAPGTFSLDLETASAGGPTSVVLHKDLGTTPPQPTIVTGWDSVGPTATLKSYLCVQNNLPSSFYAGTLIHLASDGTHLEQIGGSDCQAWDELVDGTVLCGTNDWQSFSVRRRDGALLWSGVGDDVLQDVSLSPDGSAVASSYPAKVYLRDGTRVASGVRAQVPQTQIVGWAGSGSVVILREDGHIGLGSDRDLNIFMDLGIVIASPCPTCGFFDVRAIGTLPVA